MRPRDHLAHYLFRNPEVDLPLEVLNLEQLRARLTPSARNALHRGDFHQLFIVRDAPVSATVDFTQHSCSHGGVLHVRPGQVVRLPHGDNDRQSTAVLFTSVFPQQFPPLAGFLGAHGPTVHTIRTDLRPAFLRSVTELEECYRHAMARGPGDIPARLLVRQVLGVVLLRMVTDSDDELNAEEGQATELSRRFHVELERTFRDTKSAAAYAHRLGYSTRTLDRACVATTGQTAKELIDNRVILEAKRLLAHTSIPVGELATSLGFSEQTNFSKYFHRLTGHSPHSFRQEHR